MAGRREGAEGMWGEGGIKKGGSSVSLIPRRIARSGWLDGLFVNLERTITADRLEVEEEEQVDHRHGSGDVGIGLEGLAVAHLIRRDDGLLGGGAAFFSGFSGAKFFGI